MSELPIDQATNIRKGEELDLSKLQPFLLKYIPNASGELTIHQFPGGASNLTYLLKLGEQDLVLRRPPFGANIKSAHDMGREYKVLNALSKHYGKAPKPLLYTEDESILGAPFYVMERVEGTILRHDGGKAKQQLGEQDMHNIADALMDTLVELHALDYEATGLGDLGKPAGYAERQITGWTKRYFKAKTDEHLALECVIEWLNANIPTESGSSIIHNDYKHDNVVLDANDFTKVIAILDWEMCTLGDPLMDLGSTLGYWMNPNDPPLMRTVFPNPSVLPGNPTRGELIKMYEAKSGRKIDNPVFYFAYGLFKLAVIVQQIYARYVKGYTQDPRFKNMNVMVGALGEMADKAITNNDIDNLN